MRRVRLTGGCGSSKGENLCFFGGVWSFLNVDLALCMAFDLFC